MSILETAYRSAVQGGRELRLEARALDLRSPKPIVQAAVSAQL
jgi:hypothetical protein